MKQIGLDLGAGRLKIACCERGRVRRLAVSDLPEQSPEGPAAAAILAKLIRNAAREAGIEGGRAALLLDEDEATVRRFLPDSAREAAVLQELELAFKDLTEQKVIGVMI